VNKTPAQAESERTRLVPPERQDQFEVVPAKLFIGLEDDWRVVPVEMLSALEKGCKKS